MSYLLPVFILSFLGSFLSGYLMIRAYEKRAQAVIRTVMSSTALKFFIYLGILVVISLTDYDNIRPMAAIVLSFYILTTVYEKTYLYRSMNNASSSPE